MMMTSRQFCTFVLVATFCIQFVTPILDADIDKIIELSLKFGDNHLKEVLEKRHDYRVHGVDRIRDVTTRRQLNQLKLPNRESKTLEELGIIGISAAREIQRLTNETYDNYSDDQKEAFAEAYRLYIQSQYTIPHPTCTASDPYRTFDGSCNNLDNPTWGMAETAEQRFLAPLYDDGLNEPSKIGSYGLPLPSARKVSNVVFSSSRPASEKELTVIHMAWGQFLDHDVVRTPQSTDEDNAAIECCGVSGPREECFPIEIPFDDRVYDDDCMNFVRSMAAPSRDFAPGPRQQLNEITSYIDASNVYGSSKAESDSLRSFVSGEMKSNTLGRLPDSGEDNCFKDASGDYCPVAGDARVNVLPNLGSMHSLFLREHNRIVGELKLRNPTWDDEKLFQEGRKIVGAIIQHITYTEYLPCALSDSYMNYYDLKSTQTGFNNVYRDSIDASIRNAFASAAYRFGHSQIPDVQARYDKAGNAVDIKATHKSFFHPHMTLLNDNGKAGLEGVIRWLVSFDCPQMDRNFEDSIRNKLFIDEEGHSLDLSALNIQRGRDHGVPKYNQWREFCGLPKAESFLKKRCGLSDHKKADAYLLSLVYRHPDDIDLYVGGITEKPVEGGILGPTFSCIIANQFELLKTGDRFWYENEFSQTGFTEEQLNEIKKVSLSRVICDNIDVDKIQKTAFVPAGNDNPLSLCSDIRGIDFAKWEPNQENEEMG